MSERPVDLTTFDTVAALIEQHLGDTHTAFAGRIESYDADTQTASIKPMTKFPTALPNGDYEFDDLPIITSVPVLFMRSAGWFVAVSLDVGDSVLVVATELSIAAWRESAGNDPAYPGDLRRHHLANSVCIPGLFPTSKKLAHAPPITSTGGDAPAIVIGSDADDGMRVTLHQDGSLKITQGTTVVFQIDADGTNHAGGVLADQFVALANLVNARLSQIQVAFDSHTHVVAGPAPAFVMVAGLAAPVLSPIGSLADVSATKSKAT